MSLPSDSAAEVRALAFDDATLKALVAIEASQAHGMNQLQLADVLSDGSRCVLGMYCRVIDESRESLAGFIVMARGPFEAEIEAITVLADQRGRGIGRQLLVAAIDYANRWYREACLERLLLEVRANNLPARALYARAGFQVDGVRKGYYPAADGKREDAVLMSLPLG